MEASLPGQSRGKRLDQAIWATGIPDKSRAAPVLLAQGPIWTCSPQDRRHLNHQSQEKQGRGLGPLASKPHPFLLLPFLQETHGQLCQVRQRESGSIL